MKNFTLILLFWFPAIFTTGCIKWQSGTAEKISHSARPAAVDNPTEKKTIWVSVSAYTPQGRSMEEIEKDFRDCQTKNTLDAIEKDALDCRIEHRADVKFKTWNEKEENYAGIALRNAINESGNFTFAASEAEADYSLEVKVTRYNPSIGLAVYTAVVGILTLTAIPTYNKLYYDYDIALLSKNTQETKKRVIQQKHHMLAWLPLIVATPFVLPFNTQGKLMDRVSRDIAAWCYEQTQQDDNLPHPREETAFTPEKEATSVTPNNDVAPQPDTEQQLPPSESLSPPSSNPISETTNELTPASSGELAPAADPAEQSPTAAVE